MAQLRIDRIKAREAQERSSRSSNRSSKCRRSIGCRAAPTIWPRRSAALKKVAEAGAPLYQSLDDAQKGRFVRLAHMLRPHRPGFERWRRFGEGYGRGFRGPDYGPGAPGFRHRMFDPNNDDRMQQPGDDGSQL